MRLLLVMRPEVIQRLTLTQCLDLTGGLTDTIFPEVEALLRASSDYQKALDHAAKRKNADRYRSVIDFLYGELFPERQPEIFRYYRTEKEEHKAKAILNERERLMYAWLMLRALVIAYAAFSEQRRLSWTQLRREVALAA